MLLPLIQRFWFVICLCLPPGAGAQVMNDPVLQQTIQHTLDDIYNLDFVAADAQIRQLRSRYPQHPVGPILLATKLELQHLPVHENKAATVQFTQAVDQSLTLAKRMLDNDKNDPEGIFFALTAHSYLASLYNNQGESIKAVSESKRAYGYLKDGFHLTTKSPDFYFTTGLYNYYVERYPVDHPVVRPFMFFFADGNMAQGIKQMDIATKRALFMRPVANYFLAHVLIKHEMQPGRATAYTKYLADKYPNNPLFGMINAEALLLAGRYAEARPYVQRLKQLRSKLIPLAVSAFEGMLAEHADKDDLAASDLYQAALRHYVNGAYTKEYQAFAYAGLARIATRANDRNRARLHYKKALAIAEYKSVIREAKAFK